MSRCAATLIVLALLIGAGSLRAEPYLAVQQGYKCNSCHVNPSGGGLRTDFGIIFSQTAMPAKTLGYGGSVWTGKLMDFLRLGGDLRANWARNTVPEAPSQQKFSLDQVRLYTDIAVIPERLGIYIDEQVAPNAAQMLEGYVRLGNPSQGFYLKGGKFYLPFGWRLQDQSSFVREVTGISMSAADQGVEMGYERAAWSAQLDFTNGIVNVGSSSGHQVTGQLVYIQPSWRLGAASSWTKSDAGNRAVAGIFGGLRTGPIAWLGEVDFVSDQGFPEGTRKLASGLAEADWNFAKGQNLKLTGELLDPDRAIRADQQTRWSLLYEFTPMPFLQLRAGFRRYRGIPQSNIQNRRLTFIELHGFF
jgi:hypothetical protein